MSDEQINDLTENIINCACSIYGQLGPGYRPNTYEDVFTHELMKKKLNFSNDSTVKVNYNGLELASQSVDMIVENKIAVDLKNSPAIARLHEQQMQTYLRISGKPAGLILNFGGEKLEIKKVVNRK